MFSLKKLWDREWYYRKAFAVLSCFASKGFTKRMRFEYQVRQQFRSTFAKRLHLWHPKSLNEKLIWLSLYWRHPLKTLCADKVKVRDYVSGKGLSGILTPVLGIYSSSNEIPFEKLPAQFVLKCNHGCAYNIIVEDQNLCDFRQICQQLDAWLAETYHGGITELHYKDIHPHLIICEKYLCKDNQKQLVDYKIHCLNGTPEYVQVCYDRDEKGIAHRASYSLEWEPLHYFKEQECVVEKPNSLEKMISYAKVLSADFPFVRVDFYEVDDKPILSELTFTPFGNMIYWIKDDVMNTLGEKLILPSKYLV